MKNDPLGVLRAAAAALLLVPAAASAQEFLLTATDASGHFLARLDASGAVLARTASSPVPMGAARFIGSRWVTPVGSQGLVFDDDGAPIARFALPGVWCTLDPLPDGRMIVRDPFIAFQVFVLQPHGAVADQWTTGFCAGGPDFGLRTARGGEVWLAEGCGASLERYDVTGKLLDRLALTVGVDSLFDDSCDDFVPAPDGTIWMRHGYNPTMLSHLAWDGTLLASFAAADLASGIAVEQDGSVWVRDDGNRVLLHYEANGSPLGLTPYPSTWDAWSMDIR